MPDQRADDYEPPAATEEERRTRHRFDAHFAFTVNAPSVKREGFFHHGRG